MSEMESQEELIEEVATKRAELTAEQVYEILKKGDEVVNARIRRLKFRGEIAYPVRFRNCVLISPEFNSVTFKEPVTFLTCTIDRPQFQRKIVFEKDLKLDGSIVNKANFARMTVKGQLTAPHTEFRGKLVFAECVFEQRVSFWEAKLNAWTDFRNCVFETDADFRSMHAEQGFVLTNSHFKGDFLFRGTNVEKKFQADGCLFEKLLDLSKAKLHDFTYLEGIKQGPSQTFGFLNTVGERIRVHPEQVEGRLASELAGNHEDAMQEYGLLKKCYSALHRFDQEDWAFYRFKVAQRRAKPTSWRRPWSKWRHFCEWLFLDIGCGYGTNPARAVRMAAVIILGFALLYGVNAEMFYAEKLPFPDAEGGKAAVANKVMIGLITSVSVFTSGMGGIREVAQGWMNIPVMVESIMGTLLFGLFIVAFSRKVIR